MHCMLFNYKVIFKYILSFLSYLDNGKLSVMFILDKSMIVIFIPYPFSVTILVLVPTEIVI